MKRLLIEPDLVQMLVQIVARRDLPALHVGAVRDDPVPPIANQKVCLLVEHEALELAKYLAGLNQIGLEKG